MIAQIESVKLKNFEDRPNAWASPKSELVSRSTREGGAGTPERLNVESPIFDRVFIGGFRLFDLTNSRQVDKQKTSAARSLRDDIPQPALQSHLSRTAASGFKPVVEIPNLHTMLDCRLCDAHHEAGGKSEITPFILTEDPEGLGDGFEEALSPDLDRVLDAQRIAAGADGHAAEDIIFGFCSPQKLCTGQ
jgi:hypothetical protein